MLTAEALSLHAVLYGQHTRLEAVTLGLVRLLGAVGRDGTRLLAELQVRVTAGIGLLHRLVATQSRRDANLLLAVVDVRDAVA